MSIEISTDMVQRPSNPQSATQGEVAKRGSISGRLLQTVPEKGNCSDTKKKKLKGMYARSTFSRNYLFLCQQFSHVYDPISLLSGQRNLTWHYQQHFVQTLIETKHLHKWSKENCCKSDDSECIFFSNC